MIDSIRLNVLDIDEEIVERNRFARKYDPSIRVWIYENTMKGYVLRELNREIDQSTYLDTNEVKKIVMIVNMKKRKVVGSDTIVQILMIEANLESL